MDKMDKIAKQYIWEKEIKGIKKNVVTFVDWTEKGYTEKQLTYMVTEEPKDLTEMRDLTFNTVIPEIFEVLKSHNVRYWDIDSIMQNVNAWYNIAFWKAVWQKFWTFEEGVDVNYCKENVDMKMIIESWENNFTF